MTRFETLQNFAMAFALLSISGCASFQPTSLESLSFKERVETEENDGLRVSVAVLSSEESRQAFGVNLKKRAIQPVWLQIENNSGKDFWFMMSGLDPNYFSAHEAAYMSHFRFGGQANKRMDDHFSDLSLDQLIRSGEINSGFAFTNETVGAKEIRIRLYSHKDVRTFEFFVSVPGLQSDWDRKDLKTIADQAEINIADEKELRETLRELPCCTQRADGTGRGDPLNLIMIGGVPILQSFITAGWDETVFQQDFRSLFGAAYLYGRTPDVQFQKARRKVDSVNLVQLWISPFRYNGELIVVGSVARSIDPNVDEALQYVIEDLATIGSVRRYGWVDGVGRVNRESPRQNFANAPYWTDGRRAVLEISPVPVELDNIDVFPWDWERMLNRASDD